MDTFAIGKTALHICSTVIKIKGRPAAASKALYEQIRREVDGRPSAAMERSAVLVAVRFGSLSRSAMMAWRMMVVR